MDSQVTAALIGGSATILAAGVGLLVVRSRGGTSETNARVATPLAERLKFVDVAVEASTHDWYEDKRIDWHEDNRILAPARHARWYIKKSDTTPVPTSRSARPS